MSERYRNQSFLGSNSQHRIATTRIGIVGLGGGGSHIVQQLAHIGFQKYLICDPDTIEDRNLNRLIGATVHDLGKPKIDVARRMITGLQPAADIQSFKAGWQEHSAELATCDLIFGALDSFGDRRDFEAFTRRSLIPYIDIGMTIKSMDGHPPRMAGQVILSMPGNLCMHCLEFLTPEVLAAEATEYGDAGPRPQVVWPNGILASVAVGVGMDLITNWSESLTRVIYLSYDGNKNWLSEDRRLEYRDLNAPCPHYPLEKAGKVQFRKV